MIEDLLRHALAEADVAEHTVVLLLVPGQAPEGASEFAYLPPGHWRDLENSVLAAAEPELSTQPYSECHRFAAYANDTLPAGGLPVGLRHEAEHAAIFDRHGRPFAELESILRLTMKRARRNDDYSQIPSEREANRAARAFAETHYAEAISGLAADPRTQQFVSDVEQVPDVIGETAAMIWRYAEPEEIDEQDDDKRPFRAVVAELEQQARAKARIDPRYWQPRPNDVPIVVQLAR